MSSICYELRCILVLLHNGRVYHIISPSLRKRALDESTHGRIRVQPPSYLLTTTFLRTSFLLLCPSLRFCNHCLRCSAPQKPRQENDTIHGFQHVCWWIRREWFSPFLFALPRWVLSIIIRLDCRFVVSKVGGGIC